MANTTCEMVWLPSLLQDLDITPKTLMHMHYDSLLDIFTIMNPIFHEHKKYIEINFHFIYDKVLQRFTKTPHIFI